MRRKQESLYWYGLENLIQDKFVKAAQIKSSCKKVNSFFYEWYYFSLKRMLYRNTLRRVLVKLPENLRIFLIKYFPITFFPPYLSLAEYNLLKKYASKGRNVVEFGSGGSTVYFLNKGKTVFSVESDKSFFIFLQSFPLLAKKTKEQLCHAYYVDIGETGLWGTPKDDTRKENWPDYYQSIWGKLDRGNPDIVLIDGRFRMMCALSAIPYLHPNTVVMIHDFSIREDQYKVVFEFFKLIDKAETLVVLQLKENIDLEKLQNIKNEYKFDFR